MLLRSSYQGAWWNLEKWWNLENLFAEENSPRRSDKLARALSDPIVGWTAATIS